MAQLVERLPYFSMKIEKRARVSFFALLLKSKFTYNYNELEMHVP